MGSKILVAVDFSDTGDLAVAAAISMAKDLDMAVHLLHVLPKPFGKYLAGGTIGNIDLDEMNDMAEMEDARKLSSDIAPRARDAGLEVTTEVRNHPPADAILAAAKDAEADFIVVGRHGRSGFKRWVLGSVAADVVAKSEVPVLVIPGPDS